MIKDNCIVTIGCIFRMHEIPYTKDYLENVILSHPDYPSILCMSDTFTKYQVNNAAIQVEDKQKIYELPTPSILQIDKDGDKVFCVLHKIEDGIVVYYNEHNEIEKAQVDKFIKIWTGISLLVEKTNNSKEEGIEQRLYSKRLKKAFILLSILSFMIYAFSKVRAFQIESQIFCEYFYLFVKLCGIVLGSFLLWFDIDQYNPTLQSLCVGGKKINCNSVLSSKYAKFFKGNISLSLLSFSYFSATFLAVLFRGIRPESFSLLSYFSLLSLPIILFSAYSQAFVIKQWCKFCIGIQLLLFAETLIVFFGGFYKKSADWSLLFLIGFLFFASILIWFWLKPILLKSKESIFYKRNLAKIKFNVDTFYSLLQKSEPILKVPRDLGIFLGNENAEYTIVKVCNPYCGPCAKAHPVLDFLYKEGKINLQIIFTSTLSEDDFRTPPAKHLLALFEAYNRNSEKIVEVLDAWYGAEEKNYEIFSKKYPLKEEALEKQDENIKKMRKWCEQTKIQHTPTIFINDYELPEEYSVQDLRDIL